MLVKLIPELGHFALIIALLMAVLQGVMPLAGAATRRPLWMAYGHPMATGQFLFIAAAYVCLTASYALDDFSVANVAEQLQLAVALVRTSSVRCGATMKGRCCCGA